MRISAGMILTLAMSAAIALPAGAFAQSGEAPGAQATPQVPQPDQGGVNWKGVGIGAGTVAGNVLYVPAKLVYGILGGIAGGAGYALTGGNKQVADTIWRSSLGGDYVLTPDMISGKEPVHFSGPTTTAPNSQAASADPSASASTASTVSTVPAASGASSPSSSSSSLYAATPPASSAPATHPIDSGAGPVGGGTNASGSYYGGSSASSSAPVTTPHRSRLPDTSIE